MKKKQIFGLSTLLLVCLLGLFTTSYANDITLTQFKNYVLNAGIHNGLNETDIINYIDNSTGFANFVNATTNVFENPNIDLYFLNTGYNIWFYYFTHNTTNKIVVRNKNDVDITISGTFTGYQLQINQNDIFRTTTSTNYNVTKNGYYYSDLNMYDGWGSTIWKSAPVVWTSSAIFEGPYEDTLPFTFVPKPSDVIADVYYFEDVPLYNASGEDLYLGQLFDPFGTNIVYWTKDNYYYRYGDWNMRQLPVDSIYLQYFTTDNDVAVYDVYLQSKYIYENTIYSSVWADGSTDPYTLAYTNFYIKNNKTIVSNGVINPSQTFSGDYKDKYDNDIDNQEDINNIEEAINNTINDTENIDNTINQYLSGDVDHYANEFGFNDIEHSPLENPISSFLLDVVESVYDALTKRGDVSLDFNHHGTINWIINTRDFITPESDIKNLVKISLIFMYIYGNYKYFHYLLTLVQTARIDKAIATLGTDEFYDTDIM